MKSKPFFILYFVMCAGLLCVDRATKNYVASHMALGEAIPSQDAFFAIRYTVNTGVSFSLFSGHAEVLIVLQSILFAIVAIACVFTYRKLRHPALQIGLAWIVAGGAGNLIDRVRYGHVVDFISVGSFPIWNFADMCIVGGCILLGIYILYFYEKRAGEANDSLMGRPNG
ncbi:MAG: signal peptidase II [Clostridiales Family XIII bacterium]|nr:signal peptidase II [Clostridiales Family XIII bacterium]